MKKNLTVSISLLEAIYHLCTYNESKILFATMYYTNGTPTSTQVGKLTGIVPSCNYFKVRRNLLNLGYLTMDESGMHVNADKIISDYAKLPS